MNTEKQRIAIAEACGWTGVASTTSPHIIWGTAPDMPAARMVPAYTSDLNAMHLAEKVLTPRQMPFYALYLCGPSGMTPSSHWDNRMHEAFYIATATAAQRAEAFLKTIGKWEN